MFTRHSLGILVVAAALVQAMAGPLSAQSVTGESGRRIDIERAERLETEAVALFTQPRKYGKAARNLREAARLRPDEDRRAITSLHFAGAIAYEVKDFGMARAALLEQAERALIIGEVGVAANALIDAAFAATKLNDAAAADYIGRARLLSTSTLLGAKERAKITKRIGGPSAAVVENAASGL